MRVDFYIAKGQTERDAALICCKLVEKAYNSQFSVFIYNSSAEESRQINDLIWTFRQNSFIPHEPDTVVADTPSNIFTGYAPPQHNTEMLVNMTTAVPQFYANFARVAEIVAYKDKAAGRKRYKYYQQQGFVMNTYEV